MRIHLLSCSWARFLSIRVWGFLVASCAFLPALAGGPIVATSPTEGILVLSITSNSARVPPEALLVIEPTESRSNRRSNVLLGSLSIGYSRDTMLFAGVVPSGEYTLARLDYSKQYLFLASPSKAIGTFKVGEGEVVDLGRLVITDTGTGFAMGRSGTISDNLNLMKILSPENAALLERPHGKGWTRPGADPVEGVARAKPTGVEALTEMPNGDIVASCRMGVILARHQGIWSSHCAPTLDSLLTLTPVEGSADLLVAGGEFRSFMRVDANWTFHPIAPGNLPMGNIFMIAQDTVANTWVVGMIWGHEMTYLRSATLEDGDWKVIRKDQLRGTLWNGMGEIWAWRDKNAAYVATTYDAIMAYTFGTGEWRRIDVPENLEIADLSIGDAWSIMARGKIALLSKYYISRDQGKSWVNCKPSFNIKLRTPVAIPGGRLLHLGGRYLIGLRATNDGGKTWEDLPDINGGHWFRLFSTPTQGVYAVCDGTGLHAPGTATILNSMDGGKSWKLEFTAVPPRPE